MYMNDKAKDETRALVVVRKEFLICIGNNYLHE